MPNEKPDESTTAQDAEGAEISEEQLDGVAGGGYPTGDDPHIGDKWGIGGPVKLG